MSEVNDRYAEEFAEDMEAVAREEAARIGFDMQREPHALFRMMMAVFTDEELRAEAIRRFKARHTEDERE